MRLRIETPSANPQRAFATDLVAPVIASLLLCHNNKIEGVLVKPTCELVRSFTGHSQRDLLFGLGQAGNQRRKQRTDIFLWDPHRDSSGSPGFDNRLERVLMAVQNSSRVDQHDLAALGQPDTVGRSLEERASYLLLQTPDLHAYRRRCPADDVAGSGEAAGVRDRHEGSEQVMIEHGVQIP